MFDFVWDILELTHFLSWNKLLNQEMKKEMKKCHQFEKRTLDL